MPLSSSYLFPYSPAGLILAVVLPYLACDVFSEEGSCYLLLPLKFLKRIERKKEGTWALRINPPRLGDISACILPGQKLETVKSKTVPFHREKQSFPYKTSISLAAFGQELMVQCSDCSAGHPCWAKGIPYICLTRHSPPAKKCTSCWHSCPCWVLQGGQQPPLAFAQSESPRWQGAGQPHMWLPFCSMHFWGRRFLACSH